jgi:hypothetical protein
MSTIDHGDWVKYTPATPREDAPPAALFARRTMDGVDWYDYVNPGTNFQPGTVKFAVILREGIGYVVGPAVYDATRIFPADHIVFETSDYEGSDPQADLGNKVYDPVARSFNDQPPLPPPPPSDTETKILTALDSIMARLEKLEKKK